MRRCRSSRSSPSVRRAAAATAASRGLKSSYVDKNQIAVDESLKKYVPDADAAVIEEATKKVPEAGFTKAWQIAAAPKEVIQHILQLMRWVML